MDRFDEATECTECTVSKVNGWFVLAPIGLPLLMSVRDSRKKRLKARKQVERKTKWAKQFRAFGGIYWPSTASTSFSSFFSTSSFSTANCPTVVWWCLWFFIHSLSPCCLDRWPFVCPEWQCSFSLSSFASVFCFRVQFLVADATDGRADVASAVAVVALCVHMCHHYCDIDLIFSFFLSSFSSFFILLLYPLEPEDDSCKWRVCVCSCALLCLFGKVHFFAIKREEENRLAKDNYKKWQMNILILNLFFLNKEI